MSVFGKYSSYYDLLYKDKDYSSEAEYIHNLIQKYHPGARSVLNLGCGTGRHDILLAEKGYDVTGVDLSEEMLCVANSRLSDSKSKSLNVKFYQGDARNIKLAVKFDAVISLFHVINYQTTNNDLLSAFSTAKRHLNRNGVFIFDSWYGPAVLTDPPVTRIKRLEDEKISVMRIAEPVIHANKNIVDVNYNIFIKDKYSGTVEELKETHHMRYLFKPEVDIILDSERFEVMAFEEWMTGNEPGCETWSVCFVCNMNEK